MRLGDKRHSLKVLARFSALLPQASVAERRAVLLHDVGKLHSDLGILMRVAATIIGPRNARLAAYHDHERIGATMLREIGSEEQTYRLVAADFSTDFDPNSSM
ncbi:MAG: HD domain-containing protein, partial [Actinomycetota bacterium]